MKNFYGLHLIVKPMCRANEQPKLWQVQIHVCFGVSKNVNYQLPIITALLHVDLINVAYLKACAFITSS